MGHLYVEVCLCAVSMANIETVSSICMKRKRKQIKTKAKKKNIDFHLTGCPLGIIILILRQTATVTGKGVIC